MTVEVFWISTVWRFNCAYYGGKAEEEEHGPRNLMCKQMEQF